MPATSFVTNHQARLKSKIKNKVVFTFVWFNSDSREQRGWAICSSGRVNHICYG